MTFSIDTSGIDVEFPRQNKNNNTQQFRDNFNYIKSGLDNIAEKVNTLDNTTALKVDTALIGESVTNEGKLFLDVVSCGHARNEDLLEGGTHAIDYALGEYQIFRITSDCNIELNQWPTNLFGKIRLEFKNYQIDTDGFFIESSITFSVNGALKAPIGLLPLKLPISISTSTIVDVWSTDSGATVFVSLVGYFA